MSQRSFTSRTRARKRAVDVLFEADQRGLIHYREDLLGLLNERRNVTAAQTPLPPYAVDIVEGVADHLQDIDDLLATHSTNREVDRLPATDRAVLRVAVWEIVWNEQVPDISAIDEAVSITKAISPDESAARVNAILDAVRKDSGDVLAADEALEAAFASPSEMTSPAQTSGEQPASEPGAPNDPPQDAAPKGTEPVLVAPSAARPNPKESATNAGCNDGSGAGQSSLETGPAPLSFEAPDLGSLDLDNLPANLDFENLEEEPDSPLPT